MLSIVCLVVNFQSVSKLKMESRSNVPMTNSCASSPNMDVPVAEGTVKRLVKYFSEKFTGVQEELCYATYRAETHCCINTAKKSRTVEFQIKVRREQVTLEEDSNHPKVKDLVKFFESAGKTPTESKEERRGLKLSQSLNAFHNVQRNDKRVTKQLDMFKLRQQVTDIHTASLAIQAGLCGLFDSYEEFISSLVRKQNNKIAEQQTTQQAALDEEDEVTKENATEVCETGLTVERRKSCWKKLKELKMNNKDFKNRLK
ncbi:uncharacterized protein LOC110839449 isoform X2 [Zootermopsis nevadensis]|uniref:uncharacterized protein LOC110839449 isoform X2 n=1 Tax=Zootermopsis nevadensis TaxID=136037 RepID=UPI000B8E38E0|nr:uncharacterized protein LOC110839449 isoform X2 [Zootermopsis nevadensis]